MLTSVTRGIIGPLPIFPVGRADSDRKKTVSGKRGGEHPMLISLCSRHDSDSLFLSSSQILSISPASGRYPASSSIFRSRVLPGATAKCGTDLFSSQFKRRPIGRLLCLLQLRSTAQRTRVSLNATSSAFFPLSNMDHFWTKWSLSVKEKLTACMCISFAGLMSFPFLANTSSSDCV